MATNPLSFCEVLEDEYGYLFGEVQYGPIKFERKQVREIRDLVRRLDLAPNLPKKSRWHVLAAARSTSANQEQAVIEGLNSMLTDEELLSKLLANDEDREVSRHKTFAEQIAESRVWRALLSIPVARRLLLKES